MSEPRWSLIVHGGARTIPVERQEANRRGCLVAADLGAAILRQGGSALDAVEQAVRALEDDPTFNAGSGSVPTIAGHVEMDAAIMDGTTLEVGAVAALRDVRHPVGVARLLLRDPTVLLVGEGAQRFAAEKNIASYAVPASISQTVDHDTVGCVAFDTAGRIAVATSTGGLSGQLSGRVGDAPIPGCGFYADDQAGGVAVSGDGESILRIFLAARVMTQLDILPVKDAVATGLAQLDRVGGEAGIIAIDRQGRFGFGHNSDQFAMALAASWLPDGHAAIHQSDLQGFDLDD